MEQNLQTIFDLINADLNLSEDEKATIIARLNAADKKMSVDAFRIERGEQLKRTMSVLLEETIEELENKRKAVEDKNRELEIEGALEKVRTVAMGMRTPDDLLDVCKVLFEELKELGFSGLRNAMVNIANDEKGSFINYDFNGENSSVTQFSHNSHLLIERQVAITQSAADALIEHVLTGADLEDFKAFRVKNGEAPDPRLENIWALYYYFYSIGDGSIGISVFSPLTEEKRGILKRFRNVFDLAYRRYLDIRQAEEQARESQIQLALERVRARTMAMQKSAELSDAAGLLFEQIQSLGMPAWSAGYCTWADNKKSITFWMSSEGVLQPPFIVPTTEDTSFVHMREAAERGETFYVEEVGGEELAQHYKYMRTLPVVGQVLDSIIEAGHPLPTFQIFHLAYFTQGFLLFITYQPVPEAHSIFRRFSKVFEQTYTRFNDLKQAEAQARESQIQLALERVRARTMAMQKSEELHEVIQLVFDQLHQLNFNIDVANFALNYKKTDDLDLFLAVPHGTYPMKIHVPYLKHPVFDRFNKAKKKGGLLIDALTKGEKDSFFKHFFKYVPRVPEETRAAIFGRAGFVRSSALMNNTALTIHNYDGVPYSEAENNTLLRFGQVFEQTYTRFTDLKQAEAQMRESQIQLALERVRARTMAMQRSEELGEVAGLLFRQVNDLGIETWTTGFNVWSEDNNSYVDYITSPQGGFIQPYTVYATNPIPIAKEVIDARKSGDKFFVQYAEGEKLKEMYLKLSKFGNQGQYAKMLEDGTQFPSSQVNHFVFGPKVSLMFITYKAVPEAHEIFKRFGKVFEQTYTRFLDLKQAEEQVRESQIQLALERVRARTMAMQRSEELAETVFILFQQFKELGENPDQATIGIINEKEHVIEYWVTMYGNQNNKVYKFSIDEPNVTGKIYKAWKQKKKSLVIDLSGKALHDFAKYRESMGGAKLNKNEKRRIINVGFFSRGLMNVQSTEARSEESIRLLERFAAVFEGTYTRFLDLQKAEAQAREAQIEAALERVRSRTLAMQKSDELAETAAVLFRQMISLGIEPNRLYIGITRDETTEIEFWITDEDGSKVSTMFTADSSENISMKKIHDAWKAHAKSIIVDMKGKELTDYFHYLGDILRVPFKGGLAQKRRVQYISFFSNGFIGMASPDDQPQATIDLLDRFAYVFNLTYTRFNDLKLAEMHAIQAEQDLAEIKAARKRAEDALTELRATQKQLIQSEKMASLGELTAGIAHEIQNPLNFVNNFSEVSAELIDEMEEELAKGDTEEAMAIAGDIKQNLEKIRHHGKRADGIVKGMLQHSRASSNVKEPTDMNKLADEYLHLAYHGLRAKDKSFNAELITHLDEKLPRANVVPQDVGRVILNMINNAFYATQQKAKVSNEAYKPEVMLTTCAENGQVLIKVKDNGIGIPDSVKDKIMQPFFTTKPTGEGTGLGLSLSYDIIVKGHGGSININTKEGEGSEFIIDLPIV